MFDVRNYSLGEPLLLVCKPLWKLKPANIKSDGHDISSKFLSSLFQKSESESLFLTEHWVNFWFWFFDYFIYFGS